MWVFDANGLDRPQLNSDDEFFVTVLPELTGSIPSEVRPVSRFPEEVYQTTVFPSDGPFRSLGRAT